MAIHKYKQQKYKDYIETKAHIRELLKKQKESSKNLRETTSEVLKDE